MYNSHYILAMDKIKLEELVKQGNSIRQISSAMNKGATTVRYWLQKYELGTKKLQRCKCGENRPHMFTEGRYSSCKKCRNALQIECYRKRKREAVEYKGGRCVRCGYEKCLAALDFHHLDPMEKDPDWKLMRSWSVDRIKNELDKCELVCSNCHAEIHYGG